MPTLRFVVACNNDHANSKPCVAKFNSILELKKILASFAKNKFDRGRGIKFYMKGNYLEDMTGEEVQDLENDTLVLLVPEGETPVGNAKTQQSKAEDSMGETVIVKNRADINAYAIEQLKNVSKLPGMILCVGMPDLHPGNKFPIGAACLSRILYPELVGQDIGCGMTLFSTHHKCSLSKRELEKLVAIFGNTSFGGKSAGYIDPFIKSHDDVFGTVGAGNHFAELQSVEKLLVPDLLDINSLYILVHSGSRTLGESILKRYQDDHEMYKRYHDCAVEWAKKNRQQVAQTFADSCSISLEGTVLDICHNNVEIVDDGLFLHRKGVAPTNKGLIAIPGSRGTYTYIVRPTNDEEIQQQYNRSVAHGAGRLYSRNEVEERLRKRITSSNFKGQFQDIHVVYKDKSLLLQEAPEAYKNIDDVVDDLVQVGLINVVAVMKPLLTWKIFSF